MPGQLARALERLRAGGMVVVCDDPDREDEGDLCMAAELVTPEAIAFMACNARGLICLSLPEDRCDELDLPLMVPGNAGSDVTGFTVSIEAAAGVTTGISAADRARTIRVAVDPGSGPADLVRPGHVFPLRARRGGVLERRGQTEAAVDLTRLAGLTPGGVLCEVINDDGTMARGRDLQSFCRRHDLPAVTVEHIAGYVRTLAPAVTAV
jgi:3,4-dihydroxy 2-butanone 4-phosphate synthase / GTP cyclohydrolase II